MERRGSLKEHFLFVGQRLVEEYPQVLDRHAVRAGDFLAACSGLRSSGFLV